MKLIAMILELSLWMFLLKISFTEERQKALNTPNYCPNAQLSASHCKVGIQQLVYHATIWFTPAHPSASSRRRAGLFARVGRHRTSDDRTHNLVTGVRRTGHRRGVACSGRARDPAGAPGVTGNLVGRSRRQVTGPGRGGTGRDVKGVGGGSKGGLGGEVRTSWGGGR